MAIAPRVHHAVSSPTAYAHPGPAAWMSLPSNTELLATQNVLLPWGACEKCRTPGPAPDLRNQTLHFNTTPIPGDWYAQ